MADGITVGVDLGSTAVKVVFAGGGEILWHGVLPTAPGQEALAAGLIDRGLSDLRIARESIARVVSTGYGRKLFLAADRIVDEISANALGVFIRSGGRACTVINIGGQDLKVMTLGEKGRVLDFKMNDKCAAGTGRFFEQIARILDTPISEFEKLCADARDEVEINSTCVVFAESEIVSLLARGVRKEDILKALHASIARRVAGLLDSRAADGAVFADGGPAQNGALISAIEDELMAEVHVLDASQFTVAYGATQL
jgi:predicted CoA-substrate-specific enzyme activase